MVFGGSGGTGNKASKLLISDKESRGSSFMVMWD
jgi:hypothetical protein